MRRSGEYEYEYHKAYVNYDIRTESEKILEYGSIMLLVMGILLICLVTSAILLIIIPKTMPILYLIFTIIHFIAKWGLIISIPVWIIIEIVGNIKRLKEKRE